MKLINGVNVFLLLALSSLFSSTTAICVPRNYSDIESPLLQQQSPSSAPTSSAQTESPTASAPSESPIDSAPFESSFDYTPSESPFAYAPSEAPTASVDSESESESESESGSESESDSESGLSFEKLHSDAVGLGASLSSSLSSTTVTTDLGEICDVTSNPKLCKTSISSNIEESMNPTSALKTEIEESIKQVEKAVATLKALRKDSASSKMEVTVYDSCLENFDLAIFDLKSGLDSISAKDTGAMESNLAAVMSNLVTCDDTFIEMGVESPLDNLSTKMQKYASNCLAISKLLL